MKRTANLYILAAGLVVVLVAVLIFAAGLLAGPGELAGSSWQLSQLNGSPVKAPAEPASLMFDQQGRVSGNGGCNGFGGEYAASGGTLEITGIVSTMRACEDQDLNAQESAYFAALDSAVSYERTDDQLTLKDAGGNAVLVFSAA